MNLEKLFNPKSIAIVGASPEEGKVGNAMAKNIINLGYQGDIFPVNPKYDEILGRKCYKKLSEIDKEVDLTIIVIPSKFVFSEIRENADKIKNYVVISAGFSEIGEEGKERENELKALAQEKDLAILGPNCLGFIIPKLNLNASFASGMPEAGNVAFISQSGALAVAFIDLAKKENMKFSSIISIGNKMIISETEILEYFAKDENTKVIGMYLEGIKDGKSFMSAAEKISKIKPVIILKAGKTEKAQKAISSHTGALAGSDEIMDVVFRKCGMLRAENLEEFFSVLNFISFGVDQIGKKTAVVTNAGGPGVLATDAFKGKSIELAEFDDKIKKNLRKFLPEESSVENPIDLLGDAQADRYKKALDAINKDGKIDSIICILTPQDQTPVSKIASALIRFKSKTKKVLVASFIGGDRVEKSIKKLKANNVVNFLFPESAVGVMNNYFEWNERKNYSSGYDKMEIDFERKEKAEAVIKKAKAENRKALYFSESAEIMEMYGLASPGVFEMKPGENIPSEIIYPAVIKVDSDKVLHKTDKKALILNIKNSEEMKKAVSEIRLNFKDERLIIQPMLEKGVELILGIKQDSVFGPIIVYGLGGIYTEVFKMVNFMVPSSDISEIEKQLKESKIKFLFEETRGQKPYDIEEISRIIKGISQFSQEISGVAEFDINPLMIYNDGKKASAVDIKIIF